MPIPKDLKPENIRLQDGSKSAKALVKVVKAPMPPVKPPPVTP